MRGHDIGTQRDVVAAVMPVVVDSGEKVFDLEVHVVGNRELLEVEIDPAGLLLRRIEIDGNKDRIGSARFAVAEDVRVIDWMEVERIVAVERRIFVANAG